MNTESRPTVNSRQMERMPTHMFKQSLNPNKNDIIVHTKVAADQCETNNVAKWMALAEAGRGERNNRKRLNDPEAYEVLKAKARAGGHWYTWKAQVAVALQSVAEMSDVDFRNHYNDGQTPNEAVDMLLRRIGAINTVESDTNTVESDTNTVESDTDSEYIASTDSDESYNPRADIRLLAQREFGYNNDLNSEYSSLSSDKEDNDSSSDYEVEVYRQL